MIVALKRIGLVLLWLFIIAIAVLFLAVTAPVTIPLFLYKSFNKRNIGEGLDVMAVELRKIAYSFDLLLNVTFFNWIDILPNEIPYGKTKEPVSLVLYLRTKHNSLTKFDSIVKWLILLFDKEHFRDEIYEEYLITNINEIVDIGYC